MKIYSLFEDNTCQCANVNDNIDVDNLHPIENPTEYFAGFKDKIYDFSAWPVEAILKILAQLPRIWSDRKHFVQTHFGDKGVNFLIPWLSEKNLLHILNLAFRNNYSYLDKFVSNSDQTAIKLKACPRGIVIHWLAGNIPILGMLSLVQGLLTKNLNVVKVSKYFGPVLPKLCESITTIEVEVNGKAYFGKDLMQHVKIVYCPPEDADAHTFLSRISDVRIFWGGKEAIEILQSYPKRTTTEDVVFGPKYSFGVIDRESINKNNADALGKQFAFDASILDQYGCNSPHTIFVETGGEISPSEFAKILANSMAKIAVQIPKRPITQDEAATILNIRAKYDFNGEAHYPKGTEWTVIYSEEEEGLAEPCFSRVIFVKPIENILNVLDFIDENKQTIGTAISEKRLETFAVESTLRGVARCTQPGRMTMYDYPWDGMFPMDRLTRWVSLQCF